MTLVVDLILALVVLEAVALLVWRRRTRAGPRPLLPNLIAGGSLLLATRLALSGEDVPLLACLLVAGLAHVVDVRARWS